MGAALGHVDNDATIKNNDNKDVADPNKGLSDDQVRNRKLIAGGLAGLAGGMQGAASRPQPQGGGPVSTNVQQPQVDLGDSPWALMMKKNPYSNGGNF